MGRNAYTIKSMKDYRHAKWIIDRAMADGRISKVGGYNLYLNAGTPGELQAWCDEYLNKDQWDKLKQNIRKAREKAKKRPRSEISRDISIKQSGLDVLKEIADRTNLSYNEILLRYLEPLTCGGQLYDHNSNRIHLLK